MMRIVAAGALLAVLGFTGCSGPAAETEPTGPSTEFGGSGTFVVGEDVAPGYYRQDEPEPACRYTLENANGEAITYGRGDAVLLAEDGQAVTLEGCGTYEWYREP
ncbi:hypothetical protein ACFQ58_17100 [Agromyces sp. NPDC056523]|uniref:hypothetical protein n=1 Tax=Agromyces sp. NPDC056523 TaxID=3345850 RepID=UPI00366FAE8F